MPIEIRLQSDKCLNAEPYYPEEQFKAPKQQTHSLNPFTFVQRFHRLFILAISGGVSKSRYNLPGGDESDSVVTVKEKKIERRQGLSRSPGRELKGDC